MGHGSYGPCVSGVCQRSIAPFPTLWLSLEVCKKQPMTQSIPSLTRRLYLNVFTALAARSPRETDQEQQQQYEIWAGKKVTWARSPQLTKTPPRLFLSHPSNRLILIIRGAGLAVDLVVVDSSQKFTFFRPAPGLRASLSYPTVYTMTWVSTSSQMQKTPCSQFQGR